MSWTRRKRNQGRFNLIISMLFHGLMIAVVVLFAAREGMLGTKMKQFSAVLVPKEKLPEAPKPAPKPPEPKIVDKPKEPPKPVEQVKLPERAPVPPSAAPPVQRAVSAVATAPAAAISADFQFTDGATVVQTSSDPVLVYRGLVENTLRSRWIRPDGIEDQAFVAEVEVDLETDGRILGHQLKRSSGHAKWDDSVDKVFGKVKSLGRPPPKGFPQKMIVRFDVEVENATGN